MYINMLYFKTLPLYYTSVHNKDNQILNISQKGMRNKTQKNSAYSENRFNLDFSPSFIEIQLIQYCISLRCTM